MKDLVYFWCSFGVSLVGAGVVTRSLVITASSGDVGLRMDVKRIPSGKMGSSAFFSPRSMILAMVSYLLGIGGCGVGWFCHRQGRRV